MIDLIILYLIYILYKCENANQCKPLRSIFLETTERDRYDIYFF